MCSRPYFTECQGGIFAPNRSYSPLFNDVWSLGIILLNLITGRNPWKSASADDCTFQAYLKSPADFLPTVLPISREVNLLLTRALQVDWRRRITLREMRHAFKSIHNFYSPDVVFEDSMARCPWEAGLNVDADSDSSAEAEQEPQELEAQQEPQEDYASASAWSDSSDAEMACAHKHSVAKDSSSWTASFGADHGDVSAAASTSYSRSMSPSPDASPLYTTTKLFEALETPAHSPASAYSVLSSEPSIPSPPVTPHAWEQSHPSRPKLVLTVDTDTFKPEYYDNSVTMLSATASSLHTALESNWGDGYMYSPLVPSMVTTAKASPYPDDLEDGMSIAQANEDHMDEDDEDEYPEIETYDSLPSARPESPVLGLNLGANEARRDNASNSDSGESEYSWDRICSWLNPPKTAGSPNATPFSFFTVQATPAPSRPPSPRESVAWPGFSFGPSAAGTASTSTPRSLPEKLFTTPRTSGPTLPLHATVATDASSGRKTRGGASSFLRPIRLAFPRRSASPASRRCLSRSLGGRGKTRHTESAPEATNWVFTASTSASPEPQPYLCLPPPVTAPAPTVQPTHVRIETKGDVHSTLTDDARPRRKRLRVARDWFSPGRLFAGMMPS